MKLQGKKVSACNIHTVVIPKADTQYVFKVGPVNYDEFDQLCKRPKPPEKIKPGSSNVIHDVKDPGYLKMIDEWSTQRTNFMIVNSLLYTEGLEFETVDLSNPTTWGNYSDELKSAGFSDNEIITLINKAVAANGLNNNLIDKATEDFLASERQKDSTNQ